MNKNLLSVGIVVDPDQPEIPYRSITELSKESSVDRFLVWTGPANPHFNPPSVAWIGLDDLYGFTGMLVATCEKSLAVATSIPMAKVVYFAWNPDPKIGVGIPTIARTEKHREMLKATREVIAVSEYPDINVILTKV